MEKFMGYEIMSVNGWLWRENKIFLVMADNQLLEYVGTNSLSELWLKAPVGKNACIGIIKLDEKLGCVLVNDIACN